MLSISLVVASSCFYRLLGIVGCLFLHLYGCKGCRRGPAAVTIFFTAGFVDRTRLAIRPLQRCVLVVFDGLGGSAKINPHASKIAVVLLPHSASSTIRAAQKVIRASPRRLRTYVLRAAQAPARRIIYAARITQ